MSAGVALELTGVGVSLPAAARPLLAGVELRAEPGTLTAIVGPNGAGKSTLLRTAAGLLTPTQGRARLRRGDAERDPARAARDETARWVTYLPPRPLAAADASALAAVLMARHPYARGWLQDDPRDVARAEAALRAAHAQDLAQRRLGSLSSGERQRVFLARALCQDVGLLLLDEPTSAQDPAHAWRLLAELRRVAQAGTTVVCALHDLNLAASSADRVVLLTQGRVRAQGTPGEVLTPELLAEAFGLRVEVGEDAGGRWVTARGVEP
ncbi:MAG: ABC transporter ATP-binding protein [Planctomycetota bacterium]